MSAEAIERERAYQAAYFRRKNADPEWRAKRLAKIRAYKLRKKLEGAQ